MRRGDVNDAENRLHRAKLSYHTPSSPGPPPKAFMHLNLAFARRKHAKSSATTTMRRSSRKEPRDFSKAKRHLRRRPTNPSLDNLATQVNEFSNVLASTASQYCRTRYDFYDEKSAAAPARIAEKMSNPREKTRRYALPINGTISLIIARAS